MNISQEVTHPSTALTQARLTKEFLYELVQYTL